MKKILNKYDLELWDIGEGMVTIRELPHLYYDVFKEYVTDAYKEYLKNKQSLNAQSKTEVKIARIKENLETWERDYTKVKNIKLK